MSSPPAPLGLVPLRMERWVPLVIWMSLDAVRSRWELVGFACPRQEQEALIGLLRRGILRAAAARWTTPQAPSTLVTDVLIDIEGTLGEPRARALVHFGRFTFAMEPNDHPELFAWRDLLDACASKPAALEELLPWEGIRGRVVQELALGRPPRHELVLPLSGWDVALLALRGIDDGDRAGPEHPMRLCDVTERVTSTRAFWRAILPQLDERRREALTWQGNRLAWSLGTLPADAALPDPATLVEATHE